MNLLGGPAGNESQVEFVSRGIVFKAWIPSNQLWVSIKDVLVYEEYEFLDEFRLTRLRRGATVVDLGANVGLFSLKASPFAGRVIAVEPSRRNFGYLTRNVDANKASNVETMQVAVSSRSGTETFEEAGTLSSLSTNGGYAVRTMTLEEVTSSVRMIDLLKFDIEGAEYEMFQAARDSTLESVSKMVGEIHVFNESHRDGLRELTSRLRRLGFNVEVFWSPFQPSGYGLSKPWACSLRRYNGRDPRVYRLTLSVLYGMRPVSQRAARRIDAGLSGLLFAYR